MKKFRFTLEPVLDHRERLEDEKQLILAARARDLQAAQDELARLNGDFKLYSAQLRTKHKALTTDELRWYYAHLEYLDRAITMQHVAVSQCRLAVDRARIELVDASKDRKVIEKLKDKRFAEHQTIEAAREQSELDDTNNRRHVRSA
jgi:flagellar FliJ protein